MSSSEGNKQGALRILLTGGGTGGHLFPAIATAQKFQKRYPGTEVLFVGTKRKMDTESLGRYCFSSRAITSSGIKGKNPLQLAKAVINLPLGYLQSFFLLHSFAPDIVFGVGGYVTGPVIVAARTLGIPAVIHEQNSVPGLANRKLSALVDKVCLSLPGSGKLFAQEKIVYTGNPVRDNILELASQGKKAGSETTVLILGGSQGAHRLNMLLPEVLGMLNMAGLKIIHQTGRNDVELVRAAYGEKGITAEVEAFIQDMADVYARADLVVSRAGATTLSELAVLGKPAVLIPYPYAADNHQEKNGEYYVSGGGALQFREAELTAEQLAGTLGGLLKDRNRLTQMGNAMRQLAFPDAAGNIVSVCMDLLRKGR